MSIMIFAKKHIVWIWGINVFFCLVMLFASLLNDANGRYPGMDEEDSRVVLIVIVVSGLTANGLVSMVDNRRKQRILTIIILMFYLLMLFPLCG